jgi:Mcm10 replication factor
VAVRKRFFACRSCKRRTHTLDSRYPMRNCPKCGSLDFDVTSMHVQPKVNVHDGVVCREALLTRGEEHPFSLTSLR